MDLAVGDAKSPMAAFFYPDVHPEYAGLADHIAFYASRVDRCLIDGEQVVPQPGGFYAGWITADLVGPFKGAAGVRDK
jgi:hypothetical protein